MIKKLLFASILAFGLADAQTNVYAYDFSTELPGNWFTTNQSDDATDTEWSKAAGYTSASTVFGGGLGQAGGLNSLGIVNYTSTADAGTISNWLITGAIDVKDGDIVSFYSRKGTSGTTDYPDRLEVRYSTAATVAQPSSGSADVGSFTNTGVTINPNLAAGFLYPKVWTKYSFTVAGVGATVKPVTFAFRYFVTNGGPNGTNSDIIGIDTFSIDRPALAVSDLDKKSVSIYPNPTADYLIFSQKVTSADVYDLSGKLVASPAVVDSKIDVKALQNGSYVLKLNTEAGSTTHKFIKK